MGLVGPGLGRRGCVVWRGGGGVNVAVVTDEGCEQGRAAALVVMAEVGGGGGGGSS